MPTTILFDIPEAITAGDAVAWKKTFGDYSAADDWVLSYALTKSDAQILITAGADGSDHLVNLVATDTDSWAAGEYGFQAYVTKATERYQVDEGIVEIRPNLVAQTSGYQSLPPCFVIRDAIEAVFEMRATESETSIAVGGRQISEMSHAELHEALSKAKQGCNLWMRRNRRDRGQASGSQIKATFTEN